MITQAVRNALLADAALVAMLSTYEGIPAIFTTGMAPGDATLPYIIASTLVAQAPFDTKNSRGREVMLDVRCYTDETGSAVAVETLAERVRYLLHRQSLSISGHNWLWSMCAGPISIDETHAYGRLVTVSATAMEV